MFASKIVVVALLVVAATALPLNNTTTTTPPTAKNTTTTTKTTPPAPAKNTTTTTTAKTTTPAPAKNTTTTTTVPSNATTTTAAPAKNSTTAAPATTTAPDYFQNITKAGCVLLDFGELTYNDSKAQTNFTEKATMSNIVCKNEFKSQSHKVGKGYLVDTQVSFTLTEGKSSIDVSMIYNLAAVYAAQNYSSKSTGDHSSSLASIAVTQAGKKVVFGADSTNNWNTSSAASYLCNDYDFTYNETVAEVNNKTKTAILTIHNVQSEPLFGFPKSVNKTTFDSVDNGATCPSAAANNKVGIIIGAIIGGLAFIGIIAFAYSKCNEDRGNSYESLN